MSMTKRILELEKEYIYQNDEGEKYYNYIIKSLKTYNDTYIQGLINLDDDDYLECELELVE